jgi:nitric oxide reductase NorD protein
MTVFPPEIQRLLDELAEISFVAHRSVREAMPAIVPYGMPVLLEWLQACKALFGYDREAGKAFIRQSPAVEEVAEEVLPWTRQALVFLQWRGAWRAVEGFMEQLPDAYRVLGHDGVARWAELGFTWCRRHIESGIIYFGTPVRALAAKQRMRGVEQVMLPAEQLFVTRRLALGSYLPGALKARNLFGPEAILPWAQRGADILQAGRLRGEAYFRLESEESLQLLKEHLPGYLVADHQRLLEMLTSAWFAESIEIKEGTWAPEQGRAFAETDGRSLFLPVVFEDREVAILSVLHAAGHIAFDSYLRDHIEALFRDMGVQPPRLEADERMTWQPLFARCGEDLLRFRLLFDLAEDLRVDCAINRVVPNHLRRMLALAEARAPAPGPGRPYYELARESLCLALGRHAGGAGTDGASVMDRLSPLMDPSATVVDAFRVARALYAQTGLPPVASLDDCQEGYLPGRSPNAARAVFPREREEKTGAGREGDRQDRSSGKCGAGSDDRTVPAAPGAEPEQTSPQQATAGAGDAGVGIPRPLRQPGHPGRMGFNERGIPYPEWDYRDRHYKRNWVWVQERRLAESNPHEARRLQEQYADVLALLKRAILAQRPTRLAPRRRQFEGEDIDLDAAVGFIIEKRAGVSPPARVYRQRRVHGRDTAVTLLADLSTSVMQQLPEGQGRVVDRIRAGILLFAESMEVVGDAYCVAGFSSKYRDNVNYYDIKGFDEALTDEVRGVIGGLSGRLATRMGAAIRHALVRFQDAPTQRRLLLILSDGRPEDYDDGGDIRYLHEDTRIAVKEAIDQGVHPFCITVDPAGCDYLPRIFGQGHYLVLDHINSLPRKLPEIYLRLRR